MKVKCIKPMVAHWGSILTKDKYYEGTLSVKPTTIITNYKKYWEHISMCSSSIKYIREGYTQETLREVIPGYLTLSEITKLYTKKVDLPFITFKTDDNSSQSFCLMTHDEIISMHGADPVSNPERKNYRGVCFDLTVYMIDEYFDYVQIRRENTLNNLLDK